MNIKHNKTWQKTEVNEVYSQTLMARTQKRLIKTVWAIEVELYLHLNPMDYKNGVQATISWDTVVVV